MTDTHIVTSTPAHNNLGQNKPDEAIAEYQKAIQLDPKDAPAHINLGSVYSDQNKLDEAIAEYQKAIQLDPKYALAHINLGIVYRAQVKLDEALTEFQKAIQLDPKYALAHINLGVVYRAQNKPDEPIAEFQKAIQFDPKDADPHYHMGLVFLRDLAASASSGPPRIRWLQDACREFVDGSRLAPDDPDYSARVREVEMGSEGHCPSS